MVKRVIQPLRIFWEIVGIFYDILQTLSYLGGIVMTTTGVVTFFQNIPTIIPIVLLVLGVLSFGFGLFRTIYRYRMWNSLRLIPELEDTLSKALDIHFHITELHNKVIEENTHKNIKTKTRVELANKFFETLQIPVESLSKYFNADFTINKRLYKKIKKQFHLQEGNYFTVIPLLKGYAKLLDKSKLGLKNTIKEDAEYNRLNSKFIKSQLKLNIPDEYMNDINKLPELSYGLHSLSIGINLINENRDWYETIPESFIEQKDDSKNMVNTPYLRASMWMKNKIRLAIFKEGMK